MKFSIFVFLLSILGSASGFSAEQSFKLELQNLKMSGTFPLNLKSPIIVNGFDEKNTPYKIQFSAQLQSAGLYRVTYELDRNKKKEKSGSVVTQAGRKAELREQLDGKPSSEALFEATVSE